MDKRLRSMSATVHSRARDGWGVLFLRSYDTIVLAYYPFANALYISPNYDISQTTMKHVRAFLQDYADVTLSIPDLRKRIDGMTFDHDHRSISLDGQPFNAHTCSQRQMNDMYYLSKDF